MRRRYPMAFALGGLVFVVLVIVGLARPADPTPWLAAVIGGAASYGLVLAAPAAAAADRARAAVGDAPTPAARAAAREAGVAARRGGACSSSAPAVFAALRQPEPVSAPRAHRRCDGR